MINTLKKPISLVMVICMALSLLPLGAMSRVSAQTITSSQTEEEWMAENGVHYENFWVVDPEGEDEELLQPSQVEVLVPDEEDLPDSVTSYLEEQPEHVHTMDCLELYEESGLICAEVEDHQHTEACYAPVYFLTCDDDGEKDGFIEIFSSVCTRLCGLDDGQSDTGSSGSTTEGPAISNESNERGENDPISSTESTVQERTSNSEVVDVPGSDDTNAPTASDTSDSILGVSSVSNSEAKVNPSEQAENATPDESQNELIDSKQKNEEDILSKDNESSQDDTTVVEENSSQEQNARNAEGSTSVSDQVSENLNNVVDLVKDVFSNDALPGAEPSAQQELDQNLESGVQEVNPEQEEISSDEFDEQAQGLSVIEEYVEAIASEFFMRESIVNGVQIKVIAENGVFPETATLSVTAVSDEEKESIDSAVEPEREISRKVAAAYTYDIKVLDENGEELQPEEGNKVVVTFSMAEAANSNLDTQVYHIKENDDSLSAKALEVDTTGETISATTDGFSYYTVEFTYNEMIYVLAGDDSAPLASILDYFGLSGSPSDVESSNPELFSATQEEGEWIISANNAFQTTESLKVTIDGIEYEIVVTDALVVPAGGTFGQNNSVTWEIDANNNMVIRPTNSEGTGIITNLANGKYNANTAGPCWPWHNYRSQIKSISFEGNVTTVASGEMRGMFCNCTSLTSVDLTNFNMNNITIVNDMFYGCSALTSIDLKNLVHSGVTQVNRFLQNCTNLQHLTVGGDWSTITQSTDCFSGITSQVTELELRGATIPATSLTSIFSQLSAVDTLIYSGDKSNLEPTDAFTYFPNLSTIKLQNGSNTASTPLDFFDFPIGKTIETDGSVYSIPFGGGIWTYDDGSGNVQTNLTHEDVNAMMVDGRLPAGTLVKTDVGQVEPSGYLSPSVRWRYNDGKLKIWPTNGVSGTLNSVTDAANWPWNENNTTFPASNIREVEVVGQVSAGTSAVSMFQNLGSLQKINLTGLDISNCSDTSGMFDGCISLQDVDLHFYNNLSNQSVSIDRLFHNCRSLKTLSLEKASSFMGSFTSSDIIAGCSDLESINLSNITATGVKMPASELPRLKTIIADSSNITFDSYEMSPFSLAEKWYYDDGNNISVVDNTNVLSGSNSLPAGSYSISRSLLGNFGNVKETFYIIDNLSNYSIEVNGKTITDETDPEDPNAALSDDSADYYVVKNGTKVDVYTQSLSVTEWNTTNTVNHENEPGYRYEKNLDSPDITIRFTNAAIDVNGDRHDVILSIDNFTIYNPSWAAIINSSLSEYRRHLLTVDIGSLIFRNWVVKEDTSKASGNRGSGTYIDATVSISDATSDQSFLFYVDDLDVERRNKDGSNTNQYGVPGFEGIKLEEGFDLDTITLADFTWLRTYNYNHGFEIATYASSDSDGEKQNIASLGYGTTTDDAKPGNYIVGSKTGDDSSYRTRFYVAGEASGSRFIWTSGVNCDTNFLKGDALQVWSPLKPISLRLAAAKTLNGSVPEEKWNSEFEFEMELTKVTLKDSNGVPYDITDPNELAAYPQGGTGLYSNGNITLPDVQFDRIGSYFYTVKEIQGSNPGISYDDTIFNMQIDITGATSDYDIIMGYKAAVYVDGDLAMQTNTPGPVTYAKAMESLSGFTERDFQDKTWQDGTDEYTYDRDSETWMKNGEEAVSNVPDNADATFILSYGQALSAASRTSGGDYDRAMAFIHSVVWHHENDVFTYGSLTTTYGQAEECGFNRKAIHNGTWTDPLTGDIYTFSNNSWMRNGTPIATEPPSDATATYNNIWIKNGTDTVIEPPYESTATFSLEYQAVLPAQTYGLAYSELLEQKWTLYDSDGVTIHHTYEYDSGSGKWIVDDDPTNLVDAPDGDAVAEFWEVQTADVGTFNNLTTVCNLTIEKQVVGNMASKDKYWTFTLEVEGYDGNPVTDLSVPNNANDWVNNGDGTYTFKLSHSDQIVIEIPNSSSYTISEESLVHYIQSYSIDGGLSTRNTSTGERTITTDTDVLFTNELRVLPHTGLLECGKLGIVFTIVAIAGITYFERNRIKNLLAKNKRGS